MRGSIGQMIQFPSWLGKNSTRTKNDRLLQELCHHMQLQYVVIRFLLFNFSITFLASCECYRCFVYCKPVVNIRIKCIEVTTLCIKFELTN